MSNVERRFRNSYKRCGELAAKGDLNSAIEHYSMLLGQAGLTNTLRAKIRNDLGCIAALKGEIDRASELIRTALELDSNCNAAIENSGLLANLRLVRDPVRLPQHHKDATQIPIKTKAESLGRIVILSFLFNWPSTGGGIVHTVELVKFLAKAGFEVQHIFARNSSWGIGQVNAPLEHEGIAIDIPDLSMNVDFIRRRFREAVDRFRPDHVIITDSWNTKPILADAMQGYSVILRMQALECLCPLNNVRLLANSDGFYQCTRHQLANPIDCRNCLKHNGHHSGSLHQAERELCGVGSEAYADILQRAFANATCVLVVNPFMEASISPFTKHVRVAPSGMDPTRFPWPWPNDPYDGSRKKKTLLFAGLVDEVMKGFRVALRACELLWHKRQDFELVATTDPIGPQNEFLRFAGWQTQKSLPAMIRSSYALLFPTIAQEALGRTAVEAMACGRPVIASRLGGLPYVIAEEATGLLCEPGDPEDLARKIESLLDDPDRAELMGRLGRQRFEEHFTWDVILKKHYLPLLSRKEKQT